MAHKVSPPDMQCNRATTRPIYAKSPGRCLSSGAHFYPLRESRKHCSFHFFESFRLELLAPATATMLAERWQISLLETLMIPMLFSF